MTRAVVFDVGQVLLRWEPWRVIEDALDHDAALIADFRATVDFAAWHAEQDAGRTVADALAAASERYPDHAGTLAAVYDRWLETIPGPVPGMVEILERLDDAGVPIYAITNFPAEQWDKTVPAYPFLARFRDAVVSGRVGAIKPDRRPFEILLERAGLDPADCLFVDDGPRNVETARALGMDAVVFEGAEAFAAALAARGLPS